MSGILIDIIKQLFIWMKKRKFLIISLLIHDPYNGKSINFFILYIKEFKVQRRQNFKQEISYIL